MNPFRTLIPSARRRGGLILLLALLAGARAAAQPPVYFVDGYHGGIYGHYPVEWKTRFIVDRLEAHPEWRIGLEIEPETWDTVALRTPVDYRRLQRIVADRRVEFTNPTYAQPYCYNISGESIIRQFAYGIRKIRSHFPQVEFTTYAVEEPCFTSALPQILRGFGFRYASLKCPNTCWGGYAAPYGGELVNWIGPDGSAILTSPRYACEALQENSVWQTTAWGNEQPYLDACREAGIAHPVGMCYQDAGWRYGPWLGAGDTIRNRSTYVTWREYFETVSDGRSDDDYRMPQEDVRASLVWGSQVMQRIARQVRRTENRIVATEKLGALACLANGFRPDQALLDEAWRTLMLAQHHDSWIVPYNGLHGRGTWADHIARWTAASDSLCDAVAGAAFASFATPDADGRLRLRICNTLGVPRRRTVSTPLPAGFGDGATVRDLRGRKVASAVETVDGEACLFFTADVPAFGYTTYTVEPARTRQRKHLPAASDGVVENDMYRIRFDAARGGVIASLTAKFLGGRELVGNDGDYALGELRGYFYDEGRFRSSVETPARIEVLVDNDFEQRVRIRGTVASHPFTQTVTLRKGDPKIDFDLRIDWLHDVGIGAWHQEGGFADNRRAFYDGRYKLNFYLPVALDAPALYKDAPFDVCRSSQQNTFFSTWDAIKHDIVLHWIDLAEEAGCGLALLSDHTTSYTYGDDTPLGLTVQYAGGGLWGRDHPIDRPTHLRFALAAHAGRWDEAGIQQESDDWNEPLVCRADRRTAPGSASMIDLSGSGYGLSAAYPEGDGLVIRLFNASGDATPQSLRLGFVPAKVETTDLAGNPTGELAVRREAEGARIEVAMPRFGLTTLHITR